MSGQSTSDTGVVLFETHGPIHGWASGLGRAEPRTIDGVNVGFIFAMDIDSPSGRSTPPRSLTLSVDAVSDRHVYWLRGGRGPGPIPWPDFTARLDGDEAREWEPYEGMLHSTCLDPGDWGAWDSFTLYLRRRGEGTVVEHAVLRGTLSRPMPATPRPVAAEPPAQPPVRRSHGILGWNPLRSMLQVLGFIAMLWLLLGTIVLQILLTASGKARVWLKGRDQEQMRGMAVSDGSWLMPTHHHGFNLVLTVRNPPSERGDRGGGEFRFNFPTKPAPGTFTIVNDDPGTYTIMGTGPETEGHTRLAVKMLGSGWRSTMGQLTVERIAWRGWAVKGSFSVELVRDDAVEWSPVVVEGRFRTGRFRWQGAWR